MPTGPFTKQHSWCQSCLANLCSRSEPKLIASQNQRSDAAPRSPNSEKATHPDPLSVVSNTPRSWIGMTHMAHWRLACTIQAYLLAAGCNLGLLKICHSCDWLVGRATPKVLSRLKSWVALEVCSCNDKGMLQMVIRPDESWIKRPNSKPPLPRQSTAFGGHRTTTRKQSHGATIFQASIGNSPTTVLERFGPRAISMVYNIWIHQRFLTQCSFCARSGGSHGDVPPLVPTLRQRRAAKRRTGSLRG